MLEQVTIYDPIMRAVCGRISVASEQLSDAEASHLHEWLLGMFDELRTYTSKRIKTSKGAPATFSLTIERSLLNSKSGDPYVIGSATCPATGIQHNLYLLIKKETEKKRATITACCYFKVDIINCEILFTVVGKIPTVSTSKTNTTKKKQDTLDSLTDTFNFEAETINVNHKVSYLKKKKLNGLDFSQCQHVKVTSTNDIIALFVRIDNSAEWYTISTIQKIDGKSDKKLFLSKTEGKYKRSFLLLFGSILSEHTRYLFICEGIATGLSVYHALRDIIGELDETFAIICTGSAGNLVPVLEDLYTYVQNKDIIIHYMGEHDKTSASARNLGSAIEAFPSMVDKLVQHFPLDPDTSDYNDVFVKYGTQRVFDEIFV